jgi:hypothetical protein
MVVERTLTYLILAFLIQVPGCFSQKEGQQSQPSSGGQAQPQSGGLFSKGPVVRHCPIGQDDIAVLRAWLSTTAPTDYTMSPNGPPIAAELRIIGGGEVEANVPYWIAEGLANPSSDPSSGPYDVALTYKEVPCEGILAKVPNDPLLLCCIEAEANYTGGHRDLPGPVLKRLYTVHRGRFWLYKSKDNIWHIMRSTTLGKVGEFVQ